MKMRNFIYLIFISSALFLSSCGSDKKDNPVDPGDSLKAPIITSIDPTIVFPNDIMSIKGKYFGTERGGSKVYFNDLLVVNYVSWSDQEIKVAVPAIKTSGKVKVIVNDTASNEVDYTYDTRPRIFSAGVGTAGIGDVVVIKGINFGNETGSVEFNKVAATKINSWNDTTINVVVPVGAESGDLIIKTSDGKSSDAFYFTITKATDPYIRQIKPGQFKVGDIVAIYGDNFGNARGSNYVSFNDLKPADNDYIDWKNDSIKVRCPIGAVSGLISVRVGTQGSNYVQYTIIMPKPDPIINSISKNNFEVGEEITINGSNFTDDLTETTYADFNGVKAVDYTNWSDTQIKVKVPQGAQSGKLRVYVDGRISNGIDYTIQINTAPQITSIIPGTAAPNLEVSIKGKNFGSTKGNSRVLFGTFEVINYVEWTDTQIGVKVPVTNSPGEFMVVVEVNSVQSNKWPFTVLAQANAIVDMVEIPAGTFMMGCGDESQDCYPKHQVTISKNFYVSKTEISQAQYKKVMNQSNPSSIKDDDNPVERLTWLQAVDFCNRLSKLEGYQEAYTINGTSVTLNTNASGYRLLTEAEWEYAARAGGTGKYGNSGGKEALIDEIAWTSSQGKEQPQHVGLLKPNDFGLYDMQGNVAEWVWDWYDWFDPEATAQTDPLGAASGPDKVFRGGSYQDGLDGCTVFIRNSANPQNSSFYIGLRIARTKK
ncbi:MAG: IPT/TIG domain-containing protein [Chloroherpetonaceae bacterium]